MNDRQCHLLDEFLADALEEVSRARFRDHLSGCPKCQEATELQRTIDRALGRANAAIGLPSQLVDRVERRILSARRNRARWLVGVAAAALLLFGATIALLGWPRQPQSLPPGVAGGASPVHAAKPRVRQRGDSKTGDQDRGVEISFPVGQHIVAEPRQTDDPSVTIVMVYPTVWSGSVRQSATASESSQQGIE